MNSSSERTVPVVEDGIAGCGRFLVLDPRASLEPSFEYTKATDSLNDGTNLSGPLSNCLRDVRDRATYSRTNFRSPNARACERVPYTQLALMNVITSIVRADKSANTCYAINRSGRTGYFTRIRSN